MGPRSRLGAVSKQGGFMSGHFSNFAPGGMTTGRRLASIVIAQEAKPPILHGDSGRFCALDDTRTVRSRMITEWSYFCSDPSWSQHGLGRCCSSVKCACLTGGPC